MHYSPILAPVVALVAWSLVMQMWMYVSRFAGMKRAGISLKGRVGSRGGALEGAIPDRDNWKAHNYAHLMEQPTLFYAIALTLALMGWGGGINMWLAWAYVALRILHSVIHLTYNKVMHRLTAFAISNVALVTLWFMALAGLLSNGDV